MAAVGWADGNGQLNPPLSSTFSNPYLVRDSTGVFKKGRDTLLTVTLKNDDGSIDRAEKACKPGGLEVFSDLRLSFSLAKPGCLFETLPES